MKRYIDSLKSPLVKKNNIILTVENFGRLTQLQSELGIRGHALHTIGQVLTHEQLILHFNSKITEMSRCSKIV